MGSWFRDYIFMPISVTKPMMKLNKRIASRFGRVIASKTVAYLASIVTWLLTGLWHGAGWNFIVWGLLNVLVIIVSETLEPLYKKFHDRFPKLGDSKIYGSFMAVRTFLLMGLIRSLDCYRSVGTTFRMWWSMLSMRHVGEIFSGSIFELGLTLADIAIVLAGVCVIFTVSKISAKGSVREKLYKRPALSAVLCSALFVCVIMLGAYGVGYDASQFIYNQF
jgi:hypothetical protein